MRMTVGDLKELLEDLDDEKEVYIAYQPHYPLIARVSGLSYSDKENRIYLCEGSGNDYGKSSIFEAAEDCGCIEEYEESEEDGE